MIPLIFMGKAEEEEDTLEKNLLFFISPGVDGINKMTSAVAQLDPVRKRHLALNRVKGLYH